MDRRLSLELSHIQNASAALSCCYCELLLSVLLSLLHQKNRSQQSERRWQASSQPATTSYHDTLLRPIAWICSTDYSVVRSAASTAHPLNRRRSTVCWMWDAEPVSGPLTSRDDIRTSKFMALTSMSRRRGRLRLRTASCGLRT